MTEATLIAMKREAEHRMIDRAIREYERRGGKIRRVMTVFAPVEHQGRMKPFLRQEYQEIEV